MARAIVEDEKLVSPKIVKAVVTAIDSVSSGCYSPEAEEAILPNQQYQGKERVCLGVVTEFPDSEDVVDDFDSL